MKENKRIMPHSAMETHPGSHSHFSEAIYEGGSIAEVMNPIDDIVGEKGGQLNQFLFLIFRGVPQRLISADGLPLAEPFSKGVFVGA